MSFRNAKNNTNLFPDKKNCKGKSKVYIVFCHIEIVKPTILLDENSINRSDNL